MYEEVGFLCRPSTSISNFRRHSGVVFILVPTISHNFKRVFYQPSISTFLETCSYYCHIFRLKWKVSVSGLFLLNTENHGFKLCCLHYNHCLTFIILENYNYMNIPICWKFYSQPLFKILYIFYVSFHISIERVVAFQCQVAIKVNT